MNERIVIILITWFTALLPLSVVAQETSGYKIPASTFLIPGNYVTTIQEGDTAICWRDGDDVTCMYLKDFVNYSPYMFLSTKEQIAFSKLIRDVKKTLPYAKEIAAIILETYEYMETLPNDKARQKHLNQMEKYLMKQYTPKMKKLTRSQGQLLMKLIDRETNSSSYHIIDAFMGKAKAWGYNLFASIFGNSLKVRYDRFGDDRNIERVCLLVERGVV